MREWWRDAEIGPRRGFRSVLARHPEGGDP